MKFYKSFINIFTILTIISFLLCLFNIISLQQSTETEQNISLTLHLKRLLNVGNRKNISLSNDNNTQDVFEDAVILQQNLINSFETNYDKLYPIPIKSRTISVVFGSWRTGSTFLGDIINAVPGTYYHYEPFDYCGVEQQETNVKNVEHILKLIKCQYESENARAHIAIDGHWEYNFRMSRYCSDDLIGERLCKNSQFREKFCNIFPRQVMKLVRARISLAEQILNDTDFIARIVLLVRDPRAVYLSRKTLDACNYHPHCHSIEQYCNFLLEDYFDVKSLLTKYSNRIKILRYEILASDPFNETKKLFSFLKLPFTSNVNEFLISHTKHNEGGTYSTYRDSKSTVSHWIRDLNASEIMYVQGFCRKAMNLWGYKLMENNEIGHIVNFNPVENFMI